MSVRTSTRRNPKLAGTAGVTLQDLNALDQGRTTLQSIGDRCGISKQAAAKRIKAMRTASPAPTSPASTGPSAPPGAIVIDVQQAVISVNLAVIHRAAGLLEGPDALGPSSIKALASAIASARVELTALGALAAPDDAPPTTFTIRVMSDEEHDEIKRRVSEPDDPDFDD